MEKDPGRKDREKRGDSEGQPPPIPEKVRTLQPCMLWFIVFQQIYSIHTSMEGCCKSKSVNHCLCFFGQTAKDILICDFSKRMLQ